MPEIYEFPNSRPERPRVLPDPPAAPRRADRRNGVDVPFLVLTLLLLAVGLVMLLSASYAMAYFETVTESGDAQPMHYFITQAIYAVFGIVALVIVSFIPLSFMRKLSIPSVILALILLLLVLYTGLTGNGAVRWIRVGPITIQPSELVKAAVILAFADWACRFGPERMRTFKFGVLPFLGVLVVFSGLLLRQPHLSATIIILGVGAIMMFAGGTRWYWFAIAAVLGLMLVLYLRGHADWVMEKAEDSYMFQRIAAWLDPESQKLGYGWQIIQSLYAIGSGGLLGLGLGNSRQKYLYLPEAQNDYIFSIICEELGLVGAVLILLLFAVLILRGFWLALQCKDQFNRMMVIGFTGLIAIQVFLNVGVVTNLLPSTGISLPFFSSGGTALIVQLAEGIRAAGRILREFRPDAVLGTGGYVCCPVLIAASRRGIPTLLHEANALPGLTTRLLEKSTDQLMVAFEESRAYYREPDKVVCTGMPVRSGFRGRSRVEARRSLGIPEDLPLILSFGGSLGAARMNEALSAVAAKQEHEPRFRLIHATGGGEEGCAAMLRRMAELGAAEPRFTRLVPYLYDMPAAMAAADLVVCRAGASTLGELAAAGKAAILIPYPHATGNHQEKNARIPESRGAALLLRDGDCSAESLSAAIAGLLEDPSRLPEMGEKMHSLDRADALDAIVAQILRLTEKNET